MNSTLFEMLNALPIHDNDDKFRPTGEYQPLDALSSIFGSIDRENGSEDLLAGDIKAFALKTDDSSGEIQGSQELKAIGIPVLEYSKIIQNEAEQYLIGTVSHTATNLSIHNFFDITPDPRYFNDFDIINTLAAILAKMHSKQFIHRNFKPQNMVFVPNTDTPILLMHNSKVAISADSKGLNADKTEFLHALQKSIGPKKTYEILEGYFLDRYNFYLKSKT